jgi:hypothetical protein
MKMAFTGIDLPEGKTKYNDPVVAALVDKFNPKKVSPYYFEFLREAYEDADAIIVPRDHVLDLLILDMERVENRLGRTESDAEKVLLQKALEALESDIPLCDADWSEAERESLRALGFFSMKPTLLAEPGEVDTDTLGRLAMEKAGMMFFYTAGPEEVHAWFVRKGADAVTCAGKIHSDLARGFIRAEVVSFEDLMTAHNFKDAAAKGLTRLVERDVVIDENTVLEIRFNVSR